MRLETLVQNKYDQMGVSDHLIWQYIRLHRKECVQMSLQQLADSCGVSHASVLRFFRLLGLEGFTEFKVLLKWEQHKQPVIDTLTVEKVCYDLSQTITLAEKLDCSALFTHLDMAGSIYSYSSGSIQYLASHMLKNLLLFGEKFVQVIDGREERIMALLQTRPGDVAFLFSITGNDAEMNELARKLKEQDVYLVAICQDSVNELSKICDFPILFPSRQMTIGCNGMMYHNAAGMFEIVEILSLRYAVHVANRTPHPL